MSRENVEVVRRILEAANRQDWQAVVAELDLKVEIDDRDILDADDYRGHNSFFRWIARWNESWESWRMEDIEIRPAGDDRAIGLFRMVVKGKGSGIEIDRHDALVCTLRHGKVVAMGYYNDQQQTLETVGLRE
jgi:ketosteroid isomerase-like protein